MEAPGMETEGAHDSSMETTAVELNFPVHSMLAAHYLRIPQALFQQRLQGAADRFISTRYMETSVLERRPTTALREPSPPRDVSAQIASYADQVKEMRGRIDWLQESLRQQQSGEGGRRSSGATALEHAEDLGKFFAAQSVKVEELGQQIDVFSEELRQWEAAENTVSSSPVLDNRFSSLDRAVSREGVPRNDRAAETVRIQLSDLVRQRDSSRREQSPSLSISRNDLETKRKAMGTRVVKAKHEAKRRKVQDVVKLPFKVGIPAASRRGADSRKSQGVRTVQLRRSNNMNSAGAGTGNGVQGCINGLQREVLRLKEILEDREQQLSTEQRKRYDLENLHAVEVRVFLKEADDRTRQYKIEQDLRTQAEHKVADLEAELKRVVTAKEQEEEEEARNNNQSDGVTHRDTVAEKPPHDGDQEARGVQDEDQPQHSQQRDDLDEAAETQEQDDISVHNITRQVPVTDAACSRFYGREIAMNSTQLRQALKLKSIAEAKVENLKKQVNALKKLNGELLHEQQQHNRHRRDGTASDHTERLQTQLANVKKQLAEKAKELEAEQAKRCEDERENLAAMARLESEVVTSKKLAMERSSDLRSERKHRCKIESQLRELKSQLEDQGKQLEGEHDAMSHKQNRRLQLSLKKSRYKYEQLHDVYRRKEQQGSCDGQYYRLKGLCSSTADGLDVLEASLQELLAELKPSDRTCQRHASYLAKEQEHGDQEADCGCRGDLPDDSTFDTSEKLLFLLDKLAKGLEGEQNGAAEHDGAECKPQVLALEMRDQVRSMAKSLRDELQDEAGMDGEMQQGEEQEQKVGGSMTAEQQVAQLGRLCTFQGKKLRAAEVRVLALKKHVSRLKRTADEASRDLEHERSWRMERRGDNGNIGRLKLLEIQLLEYKRQAEEKAKDLKHERSLRFDLESRSASDIQRLKQQLDVMVLAVQQRQQFESEDVCVQAETQRDGDELQALEMHVYVLELLVEEKTEALWHERQERSNAESRSKELTTLLSYAQAEIANANERADELCQVSACQGHKVVELTSLLELFAKRLEESDDDKVGVDKVDLRVQETQLPSAELVPLDSMVCEEKGKGNQTLAMDQQQQQNANAAARLKSCEDFIASLKKHVKDLELSEEALRYRDKVWRRGLLAFDQVLLLCFGALFAFNRITILLRDTVPT